MPCFQAHQVARQGTKYQPPFGWWCRVPVLSSAGVNYSFQWILWLSELFFPVWNFQLTQICYMGICSSHRKYTCALYILYSVSRKTGCTFGKPLLSINYYQCFFFEASRYTPGNALFTCWPVIPHDANALVMTHDCHCNHVRHPGSRHLDIPMPGPIWEKTSTGGWTSAYIYIWWWWWWWWWYIYVYVWMNEGIHLDLDTWIVPGQIRKYI